MRTLVFVQARMGSTRLPGKVLAPLDGVPALARIAQRAGATPGVDGVAILTSDLAGDAPVRDVAAELGVACVAGSEQDVLDRFYRGATELRADVIVRVTADCPLIDPEVLGELLELRVREGADHAAVATGALAAERGVRRYPDGLDGEAFTAAVLEEAWREARDRYEREHVTPFVWRRPERYRLAVLQAPYDMGDERWTVDEADDLAFVEQVYERLRGTSRFGWRDVRRLLDAEPELRAINRRVRDASSPIRRPDITARETAHPADTGRRD